jgi:hypothetical protein
MIHTEAPAAYASRDLGQARRSQGLPSRMICLATASLLVIVAMAGCSSSGASNSPGAASSSGVPQSAKLSSGGSEPTKARTAALATSTLTHQTTTSAPVVSMAPAGATGTVISGDFTVPTVSQMVTAVGNLGASCLFDKNGWGVCAIDVAKHWTAFSDKSGFSSDGYCDFEIEIRSADASNPNSPVWGVLAHAPQCSAAVRPEASSQELRDFFGPIFSPFGSGFSQGVVGHFFDPAYGLEDSVRIAGGWAYYDRNPSGPNFPQIFVMLCGGTNQPPC